VFTKNYTGIEIIRKTTADIGGRLRKKEKIDRRNVILCRRRQCVYEKLYRNWDNT